MAYLPQPKCMIGAFLKAVVACISMTSANDRAFVLDYFELVSDEKLAPDRYPLEKKHSSYTVSDSWFEEIERRDLNKIFAGNQKLLKVVILRVLPALREQQVIEAWAPKSAPDTIVRLANKMRRKGLSVKQPIDVLKSVFALLDNIVEANTYERDVLAEADGLAAILLPAVRYFPIETPRIAGNELMIGNVSTSLSPLPPVPDERTFDETYFFQALEAITDKLGEVPVPFHEYEDLPKPYPHFIISQSSRYWSVVENKATRERPKYKPLEEFNEDSFFAMSTSIRRILTDIGFTSEENIIFDRTAPDLTVDGHPEGAKEGRYGYLAGAMNQEKSPMTNEAQTLMISYKPLWKYLIDKDVRKQDLCTKTKISASTSAKLIRDENNTTAALVCICEASNCKLSDGVDVEPRRVGHVDGE